MALKIVSVVWNIKHDELFSNAKHRRKKFKKVRDVRCAGHRVRNYRMILSVLGEE